MDVRTSAPAAAAMPVGREIAVSAGRPGNRWTHYAVLVAVGSFIFLTNLGATRLWDVDEAIFSEAAVEMMQRGDWVTPYYNGRLFAHKPPFMYWCQIAAFQVLGTTEFAARIFSALFGIATLLVTYELGRTLFNVRAGMWGGIVLAGCINYIVIARAATPDAYLTFFCTLALLILVRGTRGTTTAGAEQAARGPWQPVLPGTWSTYALSYAVMGIATLVKGPVGIVLPMAVWGMFLLIEQPRAERRQLGLPPLVPDLPTVANASFLQVIWSSAGWFLRQFWPPYFLQTVWRMRPLTAILAVLAVAGPWYALVGWRTQGEFLREFFLVQNVGRASYAMDSHQGPVFYYLVALCIGTFPWGVLLWPAISHFRQALKSGAPGHAGYLLITCWAGVWIGCFSLVATKLTSYIVPAYPAVALGLGVLIDAWLQAAPSRACLKWLRQGWVTLAVVAIAGCVAVPITTRILFQGEIAPVLVALIPLVGAIVGWRCCQTGNIRGAMLTLASVATLFGTGTLGFAVLTIDAHKTTHLLGASIHEHRRGAAHVGTYKYSPPSLVFYSQTKFDRLRSRDAVTEHFRTHQNDAFLITSDKHLAGLQPYLPADVEVLHRERLFLKLENVVLLGRREDAPVIARVHR